MYTKRNNTGPEICALLGYYTASSGNPLPTFRGQRIGPIFTVQEVQVEKDFLTLEDVTDTLSPKRR
jgi:hypothetical protein